MPDRIPVIQLPGKKLKDNVNLSDSLVANVTAAISDGIVYSDSCLASITAAIQDTINYSDSPVANITAIIQDTINYSDSLIPTITVVFQDGVVYSDSMVPTITVAVSDTINYSDTIRLDIVATPKDTISILDTPILSIEGNLSDTMNIKDDVYYIFYKDSEGSKMASDFSDIIDGTTVETVTLKKIADTTNDLGVVTGTVETEVSVTCKITAIVETEREQLGIGTVTKGVLRGYFKPQYTSGETDYSVEVGDIIVRDSIEYRVEEIKERRRLADNWLFTVVIMRRII